MWAGYADANTYSSQDADQKSAFVARAVAAAPRTLVWDLGANTGRFARIAAERARYVVAVDADTLTVERMYADWPADRRISCRSSATSSIRRRASAGAATSGSRLRARGRPDLVLCLALVHHVVISGNVPLPEFIDWLAGLGADLVIEFVSKDDAMVKALLRNKDDQYTEYSRAGIRGVPPTALHARRARGDPVRHPRALPRRPSPMKIRLLHLAALTGFALGQPLYDVLGQSGEFFVAHRVDRLDILLLILWLSALVPLVLWGLVAAGFRVHRRAGDALMLLAVAALTMIIVLPPAGNGGVKDATEILIVCALHGVVAAILYARVSAVRQFLTLLSPAAIVFPVVFLGQPEIRPFVRPAAAVATPPARIAGDTPVVVVIFDQLPLTSLLDGTGAIDAKAFPAFASLASDGIWFRNATTVGRLHRLGGAGDPQRFVPAATPPAHRRRLPAQPLHDARRPLSHRIDGAHHPPLPGTAVPRDPRAAMGAAGIDAVGSLGSSTSGSSCPTSSRRISPASPMTGAASRRPRTGSSAG